jgi:hypothetical protein
MKLDDNVKNIEVPGIQGLFESIVTAHPLRQRDSGVAD